MKAKLALFLISVLALNSSAQDCSSGRYFDSLFSTITKIGDIQYGQNQTHTGATKLLFMDIYTPQGDTATSRPLVILAPGGNFITADKSQGDIVPICQYLAERGYVTAAISYRVGFPSLQVFQAPDSIEGFQAVMRGVQDSRAAVRFFRKDFAENGNTYGIDTNLIFYGGSSAGGFNALHLAYFDDVNELEPWMDTTNSPGLGGGLEGNSGNLGYSSKVTAIINIAGALGDSAWIKNGDTPALSFHGDQDDVVPFGSALIYLLTQYPIMQVDGSSSVHLKAEEVGLNHCFKPYYGAGHTPQWGGHPNETEYMDTTVSYIRNFLMQFVCSTPSVCGYQFDTTTAISEFHAPKLGNLSIFPNPTSGSFHIDLEAVSEKVAAIQIYDKTARLVRTIYSPENKIIDLNTGDLAEGLYLINVITENKMYSQKLILQR